MQISTKIYHFITHSWFYALVLLIGLSSPYIWQIGQDLPLIYTLRDVTYIGNTSQGLGVANKPARGCLGVLDQIYTGAPDLTGDEAILLSQTHTSQIVAPNKEKTLASISSSLQCNQSGVNN